jgi:hypothetical protein|tara:strand:- start:3477 stop:4241 length:765 start_codon:yes stop_codon:yes gene_type:complete
MSFGYQILGFGSSAASRELVLDVTSNTTDVNVLTLATAAGYNASTDTTPIVLNITSGVDVVGSSGDPGIITGALNAASPLTINVASGASVCGFDGAQGSNGGTNSAGSAGGDGTDAIKFNISSGTGTYSVVNSGTIGGGSGGGGGAGGGGSGGARYTAVGDGKGGYSCGPGSTGGSSGSAGSAGSPGTSCQAEAGTDGTAGSPGSVGPPNGCGVSVSAGSGGSGGSGGSAGKAVEKGGLTVTVTNSGTLYGATS